MPNPLRPPTAVVLATLVILGACGGGDDSLVTEPGTRFEVEPGDTFTVVLASNVTTGYAWALAEPPPRDVVRLVDDRHLTAGDDPIGSGGLQELSFEAVADGSTTIQLWYVRSFDDPPEPAERTEFEVIVGSGVASRASDPADADGSPSPLDTEDASTVAEIVAGGDRDDAVVRGMLFDDGSGLVLCDVLAESFPPQCPGASIALIDADDIEAVLTSAEGIRWSDRPYTVLGDVTEDGLEVRAARPG